MQVTPRVWSIHYGGIDYNKGKASNIELFNLEVDPGQTTNIIEQHPQIANELAKSY